MHITKQNVIYKEVECIIKFEETKKKQRWKMNGIRGLHALSRSVFKNA